MAQPPCQPKSLTQRSLGLLLDFWLQRLEIAIGIVFFLIAVIIDNMTEVPLIIYRALKTLFLLFFGATVSDFIGIDSCHQGSRVEIFFFLFFLLLPLLRFFLLFSGFFQGFGIRLQAKQQSFWLNFFRLLVARFFYQLQWPFALKIVLVKVLAIGSLNFGLDLSSC